MTQQSSVCDLTKEVPDSLLLEAAEWFAVLRDGRASSVEREGWQIWLATSDQHFFAWQYIEQLHSNFSSLKSCAQPDDIFQKITVVNRRLISRRKFLSSIGLVSLGALIGSSVLNNQSGSLPWIVFMPDIRTGKGEIQNHSLADGTALWVNTRSKLNLHQGVDSRIQLFSGEILIDSIKADPVPIYIDTRLAIINSATKVCFSVYCDQNKAIITVFEGDVQMTIASDSTVQSLHTGQMLTLHSDGRSEKASTDANRRNWIQGSFTANRISLGTLLHELERYYSGFISVSPAVSDLEVYGNFPIQDMNTVIKMLESTLPVKASRPLPGWIKIEAIKTV
ncbi:Fe2+-dicitrate sensor, membrane component [Nitrincola lacisaponensis]|uniref:Fe2+-dicitrate sensor, membrane component n=1 Tax=Nitrincola lacisaponensis TaxID=267850 RepID=A0A063Y3N2_9GAMM|nr:FecR domain-containing protein [Nitrincola lacisaponensis]KDE39770.1 Fe2+-dicitrate sensor, membrane component [Nitrincola lacisaponensis]